MFNFFLPIKDIRFQTWKTLQLLVHVRLHSMVYKISETQLYNFVLNSYHLHSFSQNHQISLFSLHLFLLKKLNQLH